MEWPAETLSFGRGELHRWRMSDLDALDRAITESRDHLIPWMPWAASHHRQQTAGFLAQCEQEWESGESYGYAITVADAVIGSTGLMRRIGPGGLEVGYWLHPERNGQGLATMAVAALVQQGFKLPGIERIEIHHDQANHASGAIPRRLGFTEVEHVRVPEGPTAPGEVGIEVIWRIHK